MLEIDRLAQERADWGRLQSHITPGCSSMSDYRVKSTVGLCSAVAVAELLPQSNPSADFLKNIHKIAFASTSTQAGQFRRPGQAIVFGGHSGAEPMRITVELQRLAAETSEIMSKTVSPQDKALALAFHHARMVGIHPFIDGNGRCSRIATGGMAKACGFNFDVSSLSANRDRYISGLSTALKSNDLAPLADVFCEAMGVSSPFKGTAVASPYRVASRPMLNLDDIRPLDEERKMARLSVELDFPSKRPVPVEMDMDA